MGSIMEAEIDAELRTWGNSIGIIIPADVVRRLKAEAGAPVHVKIRYEPARNDSAALPKWKFGGQYDIDKILEEET